MMFCRQNLLPTAAQATEHPTDYPTTQETDLELGAVGPIGPLVGLWPLWTHRHLGPLCRCLNSVSTDDFNMLSLV